jgi:hypothetical protein
MSGWVGDVYGMLRVWVMVDGSRCESIHGEMGLFSSEQCWLCETFGNLLMDAM